MNEHSSAQSRRSTGNGRSAVIHDYPGLGGEGCIYRYIHTLERLRSYAVGFSLRLHTGNRVWQTSYVRKINPFQSHVDNSLYGCRILSHASSKGNYAHASEKSKIMAHFLPGTQVCEHTQHPISGAYLVRKTSGLMTTRPPCSEKTAKRV